MIETIEAKLTNGLHFAIIRHPEIAGLYLMNTSDNPHFPQMLRHPLLDVVFNNMDITIENRQEMVSSLFRESNNHG